jgi:glucosamine-6-phosphate deaminase
MQRHLFDHVNLAARRIHFLNGASRRPDAGVPPLRSERSSAPAGSTCRFLGLGNERTHRFQRARTRARRGTHVTRLKPATRRANAALFDNRLSAVPHDALSMGMATILHAKRIVLWRRARARRGAWSE